MITVAELQGELKDLIASASYFSSDYVVAWDGTQEDEKEEALRGRGVAVIVRPVSDERVTAAPSRHNSVTTDATVEVVYVINPTTNADATNGAQHEIEAGVEAIIRAVLAFVPDSGESHWRLADDEDCVSLLVDVPGRLAKSILFKRESLRYKSG